MKVDGDLEVFRIPKASRCLIDPPDDGDDGLQASVGQVEAQVGQKIGQVPPVSLATGPAGAGNYGWLARTSEGSRCARRPRACIPGGRESAP